MIDEEKLTEFNELMGYYQIISSELEMDDLEIIDKYHGLTRIEDQFREMKGTLDTRPIYVNTPEHIQAHLMICFMALTMMRLIQHKISKSLPEKPARISTGAMACRESVSRRRSSTGRSNSFRTSISA